MAQSTVVFSILPSAVHAIIWVACCPSTCKSFKSKWSRFFQYVKACGWNLPSISLTEVLDYLVHLRNTGLSSSSFKVYLTALSAYLPSFYGHSLFSHPLSKSFLKDTMCILPPCCPLVLEWSLSLVLAQLMSRPFEPMATADLRLLTWKTAFSSMVTSVKFASDLCVFMTWPPFTVFVTRIR